MTLVPFQRSLQAKLLLAVIVCAVAPLAAVGVWLTSSASRSGEMLLRGQLDSIVARATTTAKARWLDSRSDVLLLSGNTPVRASLRNTSRDGEAPTFVRRAFTTTPTIVGVVARDAAGRIRWTLGDSFLGPPRGGQTSIAPISPVLTFRSPVRDDESGQSLGTIETYVRLDALAPAAEAGEGGSGFLALHDRAGGGWLHPASLPIAALNQEHVDWGGHKWLVAHAALSEPPIEIYAGAPLDPFLAPFTHTATVGSVALGVTALIVVALTIVVTGRLTRSLGDLAAAADRVTHGDFDARVGVSSDDEVGRVSRTFNDMIENVRSMMSERSQREAIAAMGELAATLAHQLRSPATAMRLDVQRAHDKLGADSVERGLLARSLTQLDRMERAIAGSLKLARSARAAFDVISVAEPLDRAIAASRLEHAAQGLAVTKVGIADEPVRVRGDAPSLEQLFGNLLTNALQATESPGTVRVSVEMRDDRVAITIRDEGPGMTADVLHRAGEPLFSTKPEGTGLGLAIARRIAAAHRGTIAIESAIGTGTTVTVELPSVGIGRLRDPALVTSANPLAPV